MKIFQGLIIIVTMCVGFVNPGKHQPVDWTHFKQKMANP